MTALPWQQRDQILLPDTDRWGRGYGGMSYSDTDLQESAGYIAETMKRGGLSGYEKRGPIGKHASLRIGGSEFMLPAGFDADGPGRRDARSTLQLEPNNPTSTTVLWQVLPSVRDYYLVCGLPIDQHGRAVHPLAEQVMRAGIPLCTGYGAGWEGGETVVVDTIVTDGESTLFNTREDHGKTIPSLVGGYTWGTDYDFTLPQWRVGLREIDREGIFRAARRIVKTKTGLHLPPAAYEIVWGIRPWSSYHTLNFWTLTYTVKIRLEQGASRYLIPSYDAFWASGSELAGVRAKLWPDHKRGYDAAVR